VNVGLIRQNARSDAGIEAAVNAEPVAVNRRSRRKEARPGEIMAAALELFSARGFAATKLDDVAKRAGVSKGTVYLYYESKQALFEAVVREKVAPEVARAEQMLDQFGGSRAELLAIFFRNIAAFVARPEIGAIPKIVIAEAGNFPDLAEFYFENVVRRALGTLTGIIESGIECGEFRSVDVPTTVKVLVAPMLFLAQWRSTLEVYDTEPIDVDAFSATHIDIALAGLGVQQGPLT
jgi:AcrR family transcriptional regulator